MENTKNDFDEIVVIDILLAVIPFIGIYFAIKKFRHKGIKGYLYITFAFLLLVAYSFELYNLLK